MKYEPTKWSAWVLAICFILLNPGCAVFHKEEFTKRDGHYIKHFNSCGPKAIQQAILKIEKELVSRESISKNIQSTGNVSRLVLASINYEALEITFPCEIKKYLKNKGYKIKEVSFESLKKGDVAIVLIRGGSFFKEWHWITYPTYSKTHIKNYFPSKTKIISVLKISAD